MFNLILAAAGGAVFGFLFNVVCLADYKHPPDPTYVLWTYTTGLILLGIVGLGALQNV